MLYGVGSLLIHDGAYIGVQIGIQGIASVHLFHPVDS
jgi:hypothetical protein